MMAALTAAALAETKVAQKVYKWAATNVVWSDDMMAVEMVDLTVKTKALKPEEQKAVTMVYEGAAGLV